MGEGGLPNVGQGTRDECLLATGHHPWVQEMRVDRGEEGLGPAFWNSLDNRKPGHEHSTAGLLRHSSVPALSPSRRIVACLPAFLLSLFFAF